MARARSRSPRNTQSNLLISEQKVVFIGHCGEVGEEMCLKTGKRKVAWWLQTFIFVHRFFWINKWCVFLFVFVDTNWNVF